MATGKLWHYVLLAALIIGAGNSPLGFASSVSSAQVGGNVASGLLTLTWIILLWVLVYKIFKE